MTKRELLKQLEAVNDRIKKTDTTTARGRIAYKSFETKRKKLKRILYECDHCAEAIFKMDKNGEEQFKADCGKDCPYHDYFMKLDEEKTEYLKKYKELETSIKKTLEEKEIWSSRAERITTTLSDMPKTGDGENQRELAICKMVDCSTEAELLTDQLIGLKREVKEYITKTGDRDKKLLIILENVNM